MLFYEALEVHVKHIEINPLRMNDDERAALSQLLSSQPDRPFWRKKKDYFSCDMLNGPEEDQENSDEDTRITLTHDLVLQKKGNEYRYLAIGPDVIVEGRRSKVYLVDAVLSMENGMIRQQTSKPLVVKRQFHQPDNNPLEELKSEYKNSQIAPHLGIERPIVIPQGSKCYVSFTVMSQVPGNELYSLIPGNNNGTTRPSVTVFPQSSSFEGEIMTLSAVTTSSSLATPRVSTSFKSSRPPMLDLSLLPGYIQELEARESNPPANTPVARSQNYLEETQKPTPARMGFFAKCKQRLLCRGGSASVQEFSGPEL